MERLWIPLVLRFVSLLFAAQALAAEETPADVLRRVDGHRSTLENFSVDVDLTSISKERTETSRFRVFGRGTDRSVVEFLAPQSEKGKYLLMLRDAMWIYLPSASRPIRISPLQRLMGQASNGDVARTSFSVDYEARSVTREPLEGREAAVLELVAKDPAIAYGRVRLWVHPDTGEPIRADFYVVSGKLIKRAWYRGFSGTGARRTVDRIEIEDLLRAGNRTILTYSNVTPRSTPERMFTREALGKW